MGGILQSIGNTSFVQLGEIVPAGCGKIFAKLEWENPSGSMKDRMALGVISRAEADGRLRVGDTIVEYTGGSNRDVAGAGVRGQGIRNSCCEFQGVQPGEVRSHGGLWGATDAGSLRGRVHEKTFPRHDRSGQKAERAPPYLLGKSA